MHVHHMKVSNIGPGEVTFQELARNVFYNEIHPFYAKLWQEELGVLAIFLAVQVHDLFVPAKS